MNFLWSHSHQECHSGKYRWLLPLELMPKRFVEGYESQKIVPGDERRGQFFSFRSFKMRLMMIPPPPPPPPFWPSPHPPQAFLLVFDITGKQGPNPPHNNHYLPPFWSFAKPTDGLLTSLDNPGKSDPNPQPQHL